MKKHVAAAIALLATPVVVVSGCSNQSSTNQTTTTTTSSSGAASAQKLTTQLNTTDGKHVADATIDFTNGYATVTVETVATGILSPGFHGMHIHAVGKCEGDFTSAGGHLQASGHTGEPASGDLPPLLVRSDGSGKLVATSDSFTQDLLKGPEGSAIVLHQGSDMTAGNSANAEQRVACGVISPVTAGGTSVSTSTSTSTVTTTVAPVPPATVTETTSPTTAASTPSTTTTTVTTTQPTLTTTAPSSPTP